MKSVACSGATTYDILGQLNGDYFGQGKRLLNMDSDISHTILKANAIEEFVPGRIPQINFVENYQPKVVFVGIGGNDVDLVGKLKDCVSNDDCIWASDPKFKLQTANEILNLSSKLQKVYSRIVEKSPDTQIYSVGYPQIITEDGQCDLVLQNMFSGIERKFMRESITLINQVIERTAKSLGIGFINIENLNGTNIICGEGKSNINALLRGDDIAPIEFIDNFKILGNESFHPRPESHRKVADEIFRLHPDILSENLCDSALKICPQSQPEIILSSYWNPEAIQDPINQYKVDMLDKTGGFDKERLIAINNYNLLPGSNVNISVYSNKTDLGDFVVDNRGGLNAKINIPELVDYGYHTVVIEGKDYSGSDVIYYQNFSIEKQPYIKPVVTIEQPTNNPVQPELNSNYATQEAGQVLGASTEKPYEQISTPIQTTPKAKLNEFEDLLLGLIIVAVSGSAGFVIIRRIKK
jgi:hypothetical protein